LSAESYFQLNSRTCTGVSMIKLSIKNATTELIVLGKSEYN
jgi:hypothetical protein